MRLKNFVILAALIFAVSSVSAQDFGAPDSIKLVALTTLTTGLSTQTFEVACSVFVDANTLATLFLGWEWDNPNLQMDSAFAFGDFDLMEFGPFLFLANSLTTTNDSQVAVCSGLCISNCFPPDASGWRHIATYYMTMLNWTGSSSLTIDTIEILPAYGSTEYLFQPLVGGNNGVAYLPVWGGPIEAECCLGTRGDLNGDGDDANLLDLTFLVDYIFRSSGNPGGCPNESDVNGDGDVANILDLTYLVDRIFRGGPAPPGC